MGAASQETYDRLTMATYQVAHRLINKYNIGQGLAQGLAPRKGQDRSLASFTPISCYALASKR